MQIHEITAIQEGLGTMLKTMGSDFKGAVKTPFQKAKAMLDTPGSFTSARGELAAKDKYYTDLVGARQSEKAASTTTDLTAWADNLASEWSKQPRPSSQTPVVQAPVASGPAPTTPPAPPAPASTPANPGGRVNPYMNIPEPAETPATTTPVVTKPRTGGKQPGVVSQTPNAIRKRDTRARAAVAPGQNAFGQMAQTLSGTNKSKSSTGGTTTQMPTGRVHTANPTATTPAATQATTAKPAPKWLTPTTKISKSANPGLPTTTEYEKLQQRIAAADAKQRGVTNEAFADLPGAKPAAGGAVPASATARPPMKATPPLQSRYAQNFKSWVTSKVADKSSGLGLADVEKMPNMSRILNQALAKIVTTQQNSTANQAAVAQYLLIVGQTMQQLSADQKALQKQKNPRRQTSSITPLSAVLNSNQIDAIKDMAKDPTAAWEIKTALGLK